MNSPIKLIIEKSLCDSQNIHIICEFLSSDSNCIDFNLETLWVVLNWVEIWASYCEKLGEL